MLLGSVLLPAASVDAQNPTFARPAVVVARAAGAIEIDGHLDELEWRGAAALGDLVQVEPEEGAVPTERTEVLLLYDGDALYVGVRAFDREPGRIIATEMERDAELESDDVLTIVVDTFNDRRNGFLFRTNPLGARTDGLIENNRRLQRDEWDGIWYARTSITPDGWQAEFAIPFKTLTFDGSGGAWGFNFERRIGRKNEVLRWSGTGIARGIEEVALAGELQGLDGIRQGIGFDVILGATASRFDDHTAAGLDDTGLEPRVDMFYRITPSLTAALTWNTDFAETEVDEREVNLSRFDLFIPEKREFFLQDAGIFEFGGIERNGRPFFSRRIGIGDEGEEVEIIGGAKLAGRLGPFDIGALAVRQDASATRDAADLFVTRLSRDLLAESSVGAILTHGNPLADENNTVVGVDFLFRESDWIPDKVIETDLWWQQSYREGIDGDDQAWGVKLTYPNEPLELSLGVTEIQQEFRPALGFVNRLGIRQYVGETRYRWRLPPGGRFRFIDAGLAGEVSEKVREGYTESSEVTLNALRLETHRQGRIEIGYRRVGERLDEAFEIVDGIEIPAGDYRNNRGFARLRSSPQQPFSATLQVEAGEFFDGDRLQVVPGIQFRPSAFFALTADYEHNRVELEGGTFDTHLARSRVRFQFSPDLTWSTLLQWDSLSENVGINSILRWTLEPGNDLFFVVSHSASTSEAGSRWLEPVATEVLVKLDWTRRF